MFFAVSLLLCTGISSSAGFWCSSIPGNLIQIDAGAGEVYGVNSDDEIFRWVNNGWQKIPGELTHVSVGPAGVWGVNRENQIFKFQNNDWMLVSGLLKQVDAGGNRFLGGVNEEDRVFCLKQRYTISGSPDTPWSLLDGSIDYYSCGLWGCWGVNSAGMIFFRKGVSSLSCQGTQWQRIDGTLMKIEVGTDGSVYGVNVEGIAFRRVGISGSNPTGTDWTNLGLWFSVKHITYDNGKVWLITDNDNIVQCN
ncbi:fish-egg lectin-like [Lithobates pipiens]